MDRISLSAPGGGEGRGEVGEPALRAVALPTSPSHACGVGPSLSPLKGGEGFPIGPAVCVQALDPRSRGGDDNAL